MNVRPAALSLIFLLLTVSPAWADKLEGYAEYRLGEYLVVDGQRVRADGATAVEGRGNAKQFATIPLGYQVEAQGEYGKDGIFHARRIAASRNRDTSTDQEIKKAFDSIEKGYTKQGRMRTVDEKGKVLEDNGELHEAGPQVDRVRRIASGLVPPYIDPNDMRVYVVENEEWNAMAAPNFSIYVFSGLLDDMDDDEVAIVLGHEIAHATHEHSRRQYDQGMWVSIGAAIAGAATEVIDNDLGKQATQVGTMLGASALATGYSRDHEDQADRVGMRYAHEAGFDVTKGPALWKKFADKYGDANVAVNFFFGDHSRSSKRAELLRQEIERNGYGG